MLRTLVLIALAILFSACGGAGGDSSTAPSSPPTGGQNPPPATPPSDAIPSRSVQDIEDAARFLVQASFGPTLEEIEWLNSNGFDAWFEQQKNARISSHRAKTLAIFNADDDARQQGAEFPWNGHRHGAWIDIALNGEDQLRQRVAFALSQLFVVSEKSQLEGEHPALAKYYDDLAAHAFGNYRELLEYVTLSPVMGAYLNMLGNEKPDAQNNIRPDENYAREVMQLFSIGLQALNLDGSLKLQDGEPIPTYDLDDVKAYAHVFTGWHFDGTIADTWDQWWVNRNFNSQMRLVPEYHAIDERKVLLGGVTVEPGTDGEEAMRLALDSLFNHDNVAPFVAKHLIQRLVTSNPSPAYIERVAAYFNDNGLGERGDLGAVVKAILLDDEARQPIDTQDQYFGKVKEPLVRGMQMMRAFGLYQPAQAKAQWPEYSFNQAPLASPSVFNFFSPDFSPVGELSEAAIVSPEMEIIDDTFVVRLSNHAAWMSLWVPTPDEIDDGHHRDFTIDYTRFESMLSNDVNNYIDFMDLVLLSGSMSDEMRGILLEYSEQAPDWVSDYEKVKELTFLVTSSPQFAIQR
ncbi:DUF1800 domain-containing protein [Ningiella sp. W23]|uniref:DUF1800 domain-containing protein n=1 Tax=Ningiella sp. W23 TaxID=3023715 RepID=UPI0037577147